MTLRTRLEQRNIRSARERVRHFLALNGATTAAPSILRGVTLKESPPSSACPTRRFTAPSSALERAGEIRRAGSTITLSRARPAV